MSSDFIIRVEDLGKKYVIGHKVERARYGTLRDVLLRNARAFGRSTMDLIHGRPNVAGEEIEEFWALRGLDFEVRQGEVLGLIGRNGAGKSTLLKILSRITEPTEGRVEIRGRVASLLEVGTGFHGELTGRENIYLNGVILGMTRAEIKQKFSEIVAFAEVERFLDTPVKRYSSGMYVRLAFAVAAHLEPEILIVDEVLAVGDAEFQKKCLGKMRAVAGHGRTILFVSHNMSAVEALCTRSILLRSGQIVYAGATQECMRRYMEEESRNRNGASREAVAITQGFEVKSVTVNARRIKAHDTMELYLVLGADRDRFISDLSIIISHSDGTRVSLVDLRKCGAVPSSISGGESSFCISIKDVALVEGRYSVGIYISSDGFYGDVLDLAEFEVILDGSAGTHPPYEAQFRGFALLEADVFCEHPVQRVSASRRNPKAG